MGVGLEIEEATYVAERGVSMRYEADLKRVSREMHIYGEGHEFVKDLKVQCYYNDCIT